MSQNKVLRSLVWCCTLIIVACSTGHCRRDSQEVLQKVDPKPPTGYEEENLGSLRVGKADGSQQCGMRAGVSLEDMAKEELQGVTILSSEKRNDGLMRIQSCGASTGMLNTYEIRHQDLRKAQKSGFTVIKEQKNQQ